MTWPRIVMKTIAVLIVVSALVVHMQLAAHPEWTEAEALLALWPLWLVYTVLAVVYTVLAVVYMLAVKVEMDEGKPKEEEPKTWVRMESLWPGAPWGSVTTSTAPNPDGPWTEAPQEPEPPATTDVNIVTFTED